MDNPTHADAFLNLLSSCFPSGCRSSPPALPPSPQLGALLRDPESDDAMSLHSTYRPHTRPRKKKTMELCGLHLFGKPRGHIRLEDDEHEPIPARPRYDSDAAPLPDSTIQSLSTPTTEQPTRHESPEEELARLRADKAARKARRRERKLKRQLALESGEFEGFIGSGTFPISPPSTTTSTPGIEDLMSDRGSALLDVDPEDGDADMGAAVYTRSTRSRSESGSSATRSSRAREEIRGNALGLVQESIPEVKEPEPEPEPVPSPKPKPKPTLARPKPKIHITDLPLSSPGAGPGPRTLENSPRLAVLDTPKQSEYFQSANLDSPRLSIPRPIGFPSTGLTRPSGHVGKSVSSSAAPGLNSTSPRALGPNQGESAVLGSGSVVGGSGSFVASSTGSESALAGGDRNESVFDQAGRSRDASSQRSSRDSDGSRSVGHGEGSGAGWKSRVTPQMGVALANRGGE